MSIVLCSAPGCVTPIDTDLDSECEVPNPRHSLAGHPDLILCPKHRQQMLDEQENSP